MTDTWPQWRPIETAPRHGDDEESVSILTYPHYRVTHWNTEDEGFVRYSEFVEGYVLIDPQPTHWLPLPPPPEGKT